ncbi:hypothetical protein EH70_05105 [Streptococcus equinus]|nr:hypothetical protein EH70_05105 [Streptococcus equinus]
MQQICSSVFLMLTLLQRWPIVILAIGKSFIKVYQVVKLGKLSETGLTTSNGIATIKKLENN